MNEYKLLLPIHLETKDKDSLFNREQPFPNHLEMSTSASDSVNSLDFILYHYLVPVERNSTGSDCMTGYSKEKSQSIGICTINCF